MDMINRIIKFWPLILVIVSGIISVQYLRFQVGDHEKRLLKLEAAREEWMRRMLDRRSRSE